MKTREHMPTFHGDGGATPSRPDPIPPAVHSADLFGDGHEIVILHQGQRYRLRVTRLGKLILTK